MEITEREAKLLKTLKTHKKPISCDKLADLCGLSADTVRRELGFLSTSLKSDTGCRITGQRGHGYQLIVVEPQLAETFFNRFAQQYQWDEQSDVRILTALLLCRILASPKSLTWPGLIEEFQISEDWLPEIILIAKAQLATFELALQPEDEGENVRFTVCGSELQKRYCLIWQALLLASKPEAGLNRIPVLPGDFQREQRTVSALWPIIQECLKTVPSLTLSYSDCQALIAGLILCHCRRDPMLRLTLTDEQWKMPRDRQAAAFVDALFQRLDPAVYLDSEENRRFLEVLTTALRDLSISIVEAAAASSTIAAPILNHLARRYPFEFLKNPAFQKNVSGWLTQLDIRRAFAMPPFPLIVNDLLCDPLSEGLALELTRCIEDCFHAPLSYDFKQQAAKCLLPYLKPLSTEPMFTVWIVARQGLGAAQKWLDRINTHFPTLSGTAPLFLFKPVEFTVLFQQSRKASDLIWTDIPNLPGIPPENVFYFPARAQKRYTEASFDPYTPLRDWLNRNFRVIAGTTRIRQKKELNKVLDDMPVSLARRVNPASKINRIPTANHIAFLGGETAALEKSEIYFWINDKSVNWDEQDVRFFFYYRCAAPLEKSWRQLQWLCERWLRLPPSKLVKAASMTTSSLYDLLIDTSRKR